MLPRCILRLPSVVLRQEEHGILANEHECNKRSRSRGGRSSRITLNQCSN